MPPLIVIIIIKKWLCPILQTSYFLLQGSSKVSKKQEAQ